MLMRRAVGIALLLVSVTAGIVLLVSGNLCSSQVIDVASGGTSISRWEVTAVRFDVNWLPALVLVLATVSGILLAVLLKSRQSSRH
jgi:hypothetical protein